MFFLTKVNLERSLAHEECTLLQILSAIQFLAEFQRNMDALSYSYMLPNFVSYLMVTKTADLKKKTGQYPLMNRW